jgi:hypothetical protein
VTRWLARLALALIAAGVLYGAWILRISMTGGCWPFWSGHHARLLVFIVGVLVWVLGGICVLFFAAWTIIVLWKAAR